MIDSRAQQHFEEGLKAGNEGRFADAVVAFLSSLRYAPEHIDTWYNLMCAHQHNGEPDKAIGAGQRAAKINPKFPNLQYCLGDLLLNKRAIPQAIDAFILAIEQAPQNMTAHVLLGNCFEQMRMYDMAYECFYMGVKLGGERSTLYSAMSYVAAHCCDWEGQRFAEEGALREVAAGRNFCAPFQSLTFSKDDRALQHGAAKNHWQRMCGNIKPMEPPGPRREAVDEDSALPQ